MNVIIIAGDWGEAQRYAGSHGLTRREWAYTYGAVGNHYHKLILVGGWHKLPDIDRRIQEALIRIYPRINR